MLLVELMVKKLLNHFMKNYNNCKKAITKPNCKEFRVEIVIRETGDRLYVKWKGYDNFFNCRIDK